MTRPASKLELQQYTDLSPSELRLLGFLLDQQAPASTIEIRQRLGIANVSGIAIRLTSRLVKLGWRCRCELRHHRNQFGAAVRLGHWVVEPIPQPRTPVRRRTREGASA